MCFPNVASIGDESDWGNWTQGEKEGSCDLPIELYGRASYVMGTLFCLQIDSERLVAGRRWRSSLR